MKADHSWKFLLAMAILPASLWAAMISGTVISGTGTNAAPVSGAKVLLLNGLSSGAPQDSATTSIAGTYTLINLGASGQKTVVIAKPGFNNASSVFSFNSSSGIVNFMLTVNNNTSVITGKVGSVSNSGSVDSVLVTLTGNGSASRSVYTDVGGDYRFDSVGTGTGYSISAAKSGFQNAGIGNIAATWNSTTTVGTLSMSPSSAIGAFSAIPEQRIRFSRMGDQWSLNLGAFDAVRTVSIFGLNGILQREIFVPQGESSMRVPAAFAPEKGFLFIVK